jgi:MFS family permease
VFLAGLQNVRAHEAIEVPTHVVRVARKLLPLLLLGVGTSYMIGAYDTIWALYLTSRGANTFAVGLSFMTFALPAMFASGLAGFLGDRFGAKRVIVSSLLATGFFAAVYPFMTSVPWLIVMQLPEGGSSITGMPVLVAEVSRASGPHEHGRTQGLFQTVQTAVQIIGALAGGALFTVNHAYAFLAITLICILSAATALVRLPSARPVGQATS